MSDFLYVWTWRWRTWTFPGLTARVPWFGDGIDRKDWPCRVLARSTAGNSALVEFPDGTRFVTSRGGIRRAAPGVADVPAASRPARAGTRR